LNVTIGKYPTSWGARSNRESGTVWIPYALVCSVPPSRGRNRWDRHPSSPHTQRASSHTHELARKDTRYALGKNAFAPGQGVRSPPQSRAGSVNNGANRVNQRPGIQISELSECSSSVPIGENTHKIPGPSRKKYRKSAPRGLKTTEKTSALRGRKTTEKTSALRGRKTTEEKNTHTTTTTDTNPTAWGERSGGRSPGFRWRPPSIQPNLEVGGQPRLITVGSQETGDDDRCGARVFLILSRKSVSPPTESHAIILRDQRSNGRFRRAHQVSGGQMDVSAPPIR